MSTPYDAAQPRRDAPGEPDPGDDLARTGADLEHDPTGVRALLAGLPDPGPMPEDVVRRIQARLEVERAHRQLTAGDQPAVLADVVDLTAHRSSHRRLTWLAAAAAVVVGTTVAIGTLTDDNLLDGNGVRAQADSASMGDRASGAERAEQAQRPAQGGDDTAGQDAAGAASESNGGAVVEPSEAGSQAEAALPFAGAVVLGPDLGRLPSSETDLAGQLAPLAHLGASGSLDQSTFPVSEQISCAQTAPGSDAAEQIVVAPGRVGTDSVVVVLATADDGVAQAWVLPDSCRTEASVEALLGPIDIP